MKLTPQGIMDAIRVHGAGGDSTDNGGVVEVLMNLQGQINDITNPPKVEPKPAPKKEVKVEKKKAGRPRKSGWLN